jgi:AcrR family transcriptional regulator
MGRNDEPAVDGRVLRGERNRAAIVDALLALIEAGDPRPPAHEIAARAGVSARSVFQHFADMETLYAALVERQTERLRDVAADVDRTLPFDARVDAFVEQRARFYERIAPVRRATVLAAENSPTLQRALADVAARHARSVSVMFSAEIAARAEPHDVRAALVAATSWETWDRLRRVQRCSVATARRTVATLVRAILDGPCRSR